jgi:hypothetical protein
LWEVDQISKVTAISELRRRVAILGTPEKINVIREDYRTGFQSVAFLEGMIAQATAIWWTHSMPYKHHLAVSWYGRVYYLDVPDPLTLERFCPRPLH